MPHDLSECDYHLPMVPNLHLELVILIGEGLPTTDTFVDFCYFLLVYVFFHLFDILRGVSFTLHELQQVSIESFGFEDMLSNWTNLIELLHL